MEDKIIKIEDIFEQNEKIVLNQKSLELFLNGVKLSIKKQDGIYKIYDEKGIFIGTGEVKTGRLKRDVVM